MPSRTARILSSSFAPALIALVGMLAIGGAAAALEPQDVPAKPAVSSDAAGKQAKHTGKAHHHRHHAGHKHKKPAGA